jgi:hypothetical protein
LLECMRSMPSGATSYSGKRFKNEGRLQGPRAVPLRVVGFAV